MITRPLDLASRLRPPPRSFDPWFYANVGLVALFFSLFGSRFILAPGLEADFSLPQVAGARAGAAATTDYVTVLGSGQILGAKGPMDLPQLRLWLKERAARTRHPVLLVKADVGVTVLTLDQILDAAHAAGFRVIEAAEDPAPIR